MMLKFKVFNIYLREGNIGFKSKRSVCQYMYNKASGGICNHLACFWSLHLAVEAVVCTGTKELEERKLVKKML